MGLSAKDFPLSSYDKKFHIDKQIFILLYIFKAMSETKIPLVPGWLRALLFLPGFIISFLIAGIVFSGIYYAFTGKTFDSIMGSIHRDNIAWQFVFHLIVLAFVLVCVWLFQNILSRKPLRDIGLNKTAMGREVAWGLLIAFAVHSLLFIIMWAGGWLVPQSVQANGHILAFSLGVTLLVSLIEEIAMRGYVLASLMDSINKYLALFITSLLFAIFHLGNPGMSIVGFVNIFLAGCLLGIGYIFTRSLWFPLALHMGWNFFLGPVFGFEVSGLAYKGIVQHTVTGPDWITGGVFGAEGSLLLSILLLILIVVVGFQKKNDKKQPINATLPFSQ